MLFGQLGGIENSSECILGNLGKIKNISESILGHLGATENCSETAKTNPQSRKLAINPSLSEPKNADLTGRAQNSKFAHSSLKIYTRQIL